MEYKILIRSGKNEFSRIFKESGKLNADIIAQRILELAIDEEVEFFSLGFIKCGRELLISKEIDEKKNLFYTKYSARKLKDVIANNFYEKDETYMGTLYGIKQELL